MFSTHRIIILLNFRADFSTATADFTPAPATSEPVVTEPVAAVVTPVDGEYYVAVYPYNSTEEGDLIFEAGESIIVTRKDGDWWTGTVAGTTRTGIFPSNYVQDVGTVGNVI